MARVRLPRGALYWARRRVRALKAVAKALKREPVVVDGPPTLLKANQPHGSVWPDPKRTFLIHRAGLSGAGYPQAAA